MILKRSESVSTQNMSPMRKHRKKKISESKNRKDELSGISPPAKKMISSRIPSRMVKTKRLLIWLKIGFWRLSAEKRGIMVTIRE